MLQEENLDAHPSTIDFSAYLKKPPPSGNRLEYLEMADNSPKEISQCDIGALLEQKNYLEELNRHLR
jgi:hypothetical protein